MSHIEIHYCATARDAARLEFAGLPRYDLEPPKCGSCNTRCGETENRKSETVEWKPFGVLITETVIDVVCERCLRPVLKLTKAA